MSGFGVGNPYGPTQPAPATGAGGGGGGSGFGVGNPFAPNGYAWGNFSQDTWAGDLLFAGGFVNDLIRGPRDNGALTPAQPMPAPQQARRGIDLNTVLIGGGVIVAVAVGAVALKRVL